MNSKDSQLIREVLNGNKGAFSALFRRYQHLVFAIALSYVKDCDDAHDVTQETFLAAFEQLASLDESEHFGNWLRIIAANRSRTFLRCRAGAARGRDLLAASVSSESEPPDHVLPADEITDRNHRRAVRRSLEASAIRALSNLSPESCQAIALYYRGARSISHVARSLGTSDAAVKMRLHRARKRLNLEAEHMAAKKLAESFDGVRNEARVEVVEVTVLSTDQCGIGRHLQGLGAMEEAQFLFDYHSDMGDILLKHDGTLDSQDRGGLVAFFGAPSRRTDHAERA